MSGWTTVSDLRLRLLKKWDKGLFLAARLSGEDIFPLRFALKTPGTMELSEQFGAVQEWVSALASREKSGSQKGFTLEWRQVNHRQLGRNRLPAAAIFEQEADALAFIGKEKESDRFSGLCDLISGCFAPLKVWLARRPLTVLEHEVHWPRLLAVLAWIKDHPRPAMYVRQLEIADVDTKFVEQHRNLLAELLDIILPEGSIDKTARGVSGFEQRYGFLSKPSQIRFRLLDSDLYIGGLSDLQIPADDFSRLKLQVNKVFITENDINGLAFPDLKKSLVIFGLGYGLDRLSGAGWLRDKTIYYWGDIDTHGFAMLDQIRSAYPQTVSFLMDRGTLMDHKSLWVREKKQANRELTRLSPAEFSLYDDLRTNRIAAEVRLEQERISYTHFKRALGNFD